MALPGLGLTNYASYTSDRPTPIRQFKKNYFKEFGFAREKREKFIDPNQSPNTANWQFRNSTDYVDIGNWRGFASSSDGTKLVTGNYGDYNFGIGGKIYTSADSGSTWTLREISGIPLAKWNAFASSSDGSKLIAASFDGYICTSIDSGVSWIQRKPTTKRAYWLTVAMSCDGTKLFAGDSGINEQKAYIYTSIDSGSTWIERDPAGIDTSAWHAIACSSDGTIVYTGDSLYSPSLNRTHYIYKSTDSGATWTSIKESGVWSGFACSSDGTKVVATEGGRIKISTDSGVSWIDKSVLRYGEGTGLRRLEHDWTSLTMNSDGTKIFVGYLGAIYRSTDSGGSWNITSITIGQDAQNEFFWRTISSSCDGKKLITGNAKLGRIYISNDFGVTWTALSTDSQIEAEDLRDIEQEVADAASGVVKPVNYGLFSSSDNWQGIAGSLDGKNLVAIDGGRYIWTSTNYGLTWRPRKTPRIKGANRVFDAVNSRAWSAVASSSDGKTLVVGISYYFYISTDYGVSWTPREPPGLCLNVKCNSDGSKIITGVFGGGIYLSTNFGLTWTNIGPKNGYWVGVSFSFDETMLIAVDGSPDGGYIYTRRNGVWNTEEGAGKKIWGGAVAINSDGSILIVVSRGSATVNSYFYISRDFGFTWSQGPPAGNYNAWNAFSSSYDGKKLIAANYNEYVYTSVDSGVSWKRHITPGKGSWMGSTMSSDGKYLSVISTGGYIWTSNDSGATWKAVTNASQIAAQAAATASQEAIDAAAAKKAIDDAAAKKAIDDAAAKKLIDDAAAKKVIDDAAAKKVIDDAAAKKAIDDAAAKKLIDDAAAKKLIDDAAAKKAINDVAASKTPASQPPASQPPASQPPASQSAPPASQSSPPAQLPPPPAYQPPPPPPPPLPPPPQIKEGPVFSTDPRNIPVDEPSIVTDSMILFIFAAFIAAVAIFMMIPRVSNYLKRPHNFRSNINR